MPDREDPRPASEKRRAKVTSIVEALERKTWERLRASALSRHTRSLEALVESADFSRGLETTDFDEILGEIDAEEDESATLARAQVRCARALRSCLRGDADAGLAEWAQVIAEMPSLALPYVVRARWRMKADPKAALADLDRAATAQPNDAAVYFVRGECLVLLGDLDRALANYRRGLGLDPRSVDGLHALAKLFVARGEHAEAVTTYNRLIALAPGYVDFHEGRAQALEVTGAWDAALRDWEHVLELVPTEAPVRFSRAMCLLGGDRPAEAAVALTELTRDVPDKAIYLRALGSVRVEAGQYAEAITALSRAIELAPDDGEAYGCRGRAYRALGDTTRALEDFDRAIALDPSTITHALERLTMCLPGMSPADARAEMDRVAERFPDSWLGAEMRARKLAASGAHEAAIEAFTEAIAARPESTELYVERARAHASLDRPQKAFDDVERAIQLDPGHAVAHTARAIYRSHLEHADELVAADFNRAVELAPDDPTTRYHRGLYFAAIESYAEAHADFDHAISRAPGVGALYFQRAYTRARVDEDVDEGGAGEGWDDAVLADLDRAIELGYAGGEVYYERYLVKDVRCDEEGAEADRKRAIELGVVVLGEGDETT
jgi:tetratricopeptide (TPR) repeat protein